MSYIPPTGSTLEFTWVAEPAYSPPAWDGLAFAFPQAEFAVDIAAAIPVFASQSVDHGVVLGVVAIISVTAEASLDHTAVNVDIALSAYVDVLAVAEVAHGVAVAATAIIPVSSGQALDHGVALLGVASVTTQASASITVERYELRGEVRLGGVLVNRRVRAYLRSSGALLGESDTIVGTFSVHAGFAAAECYVTPIDMADGATDWLPPTANRIVGTLALDTA